MGLVTARFETFPDPIDNWMVWDRERDDIAMLGDEHLLFSTETEARVTCDLLNRVVSKRGA